MPHGFRKFSFVVVAALAPVGCEQPTSLEVLVPELPFDSLFVSSDPVSLAQDRGHSIGRISDALQWEGRIAIVDGIESNVKVFDDDGGLYLVVGRPGRGPGELINPLAACVTSNGVLHVLDARGTITRFGPDGSYLSSMQLAGSPGDVSAMPWTDGAVVVSGLLIDPSDPGALLKGLTTMHVVDTTGAIVRSGMPATGNSSFSRSGTFSRTTMAVADSMVVAVSYRNNLVRVYDLAGGQERSFSIDFPSYRSPEWERAADLAGTELMAWANSQMWPTKIIVVQPERWVVGFAEYDSMTRVKTFRYVIVSSAGDVIAASLPTNYDLFGGADGTLYSAAIQEDGSVLAATHRLRTALPGRGTSGYPGKAKDLPGLYQSP